MTLSPLVCTTPQSTTWQRAYIGPVAPKRIVEVRKRRGLGNKVVRLELLLRVPADLPADKYLGAA